MTQLLLLVIIVILLGAFFPSVLVFGGWALAGVAIIIAVIYLLNLIFKLLDDGMEIIGKPADKIRGPVDTIFYWLSGDWIGRGKPKKPN